MEWKTRAVLSGSYPTKDRLQLKEQNFARAKGVRA
jgi:hypothetical protein